MITEEKKVAIAKRLASLPQDKQQQLSQRLAEEGIDVWQLPIVASGPQVTQKPENPGQPTQPDFAPLSFAQQRLWFIDQLAKDQDTHTDATLQAQTRAAYNLFFGLQFLEISF